VAQGLDDAAGSSNTSEGSLDADPSHPSLLAPPPGVVLRRATHDDVDAVAELYAACAVERIGVRLWRRDDIAARWRADDRLGDTLLVERADDGSLLAYAEFHEDRDPWTDDVDLYLDARVHPDATGRGIGTFLLARAEARARRAAGGRSVALRTSLVDADDRARALFGRLGFHPVRHFLDLRVDLDDPPPAPAWPPGVRGRAVDLSRDARAVWAALQEAFADHWAFHPTSFEDWWRLAVEREEDDGALWRLAEDDRGVVGVAIVRPSMPEDPGLGYISDLGVVQRARRRGVALALLRSVFASLRERGTTRVGLEVDDVTLHGALRLYERAGMRIVRRTDVMEKALLAPDAR
jgi:mycothiol synthase